MAFESVHLHAGVPHATVHDIIQDRQGFLWLGVEGGLIRHDGYDSRLFRQPGDPRVGLGEAPVLALAEGPSGRIWVATEGRGLLYLDPDAAELQVWSARAGGELPHDEIQSLWADEDGVLWVGTRDGLARVEGERVRVYRRLGGEGAPAGTGDILRIHRDDSGRLWVGTRQGLFRHEEDGFRQASGGSEPLDILDRASFWAILDARPGGGAGILLGTELWGLLRYDPEAGTVEQTAAFDAEAPDTLSNDTIYDLVRADDALWVGTYQGLNRRGEGDAGYRRLMRDPGRRASLPADTIYSLWRDRSGVLWVGTAGGGLAKHDPAWNDFRIYQHHPGRSESLSDNDVYAVQPGRDGEVWVGTIGGGLNRLDLGSGESEKLRLGPPGEGIASDDVVSLARAPDGAIWIGSLRGLDLYDPETGRLQRFEHDPSSERTSLSEGEVWALLAEPGGVWAATYGGGLDHIDRSSGTVRRYRHEPTDGGPPCDARIFLIREAGDGDLWLGTNGGGLCRLSPESGEFQRLRLMPDVPFNSSYDRIFSVVERPDGGLWVGTRGGGLAHLDADGRLVKLYSSADGLPDHTILSVLRTGDGLWVATASGLARYRPEADGFEQIRVARSQDEPGFNAAALKALGDGSLLLGGSNGLIHFHPANLEPDPVPPGLAFTRILVEGRTASPTELEDGRLQLPRGVSAFGVEFAALHYSEPALNRYQYRLVGRMGGWESVDANERTVNFTDLAPGAYRLEVRASNPSGVWTQEPLSLSVTVSPSLWSSGPAIATYIGVGLLLLVFLRWLQERRELEARHRLDTMQLEQERLQLALWGSGNFLWDWDAANRQIFCPEILRHMGYAELGSRVEPEQIKPYFEEGGWKRMRDQARQLRDGDRDEMELEFQVRHRDGDWRWLWARGRGVQRDDSGKVHRVTGACKDVTRSRETETALRLAGRAMEQSMDAVCVIDREFRLVQVNPAFTAITGYQEQEVLGQPTSILDSGRYSADYAARLRESLVENGVWQGEIWERKRSGELYLSWLRISALYDESGELSHYVAVFTDVTQRRKSEDELRYLANYDNLTGLPNRTLFKDRLEQALVQARKHGSQVVLAVLDLDFFKEVNESLGHLAGDALLRSVSRRLDTAVRAEDTVARLGADEFAVVLRGIRKRRSVDQVLDKISAAMEVPFDFDDQRIQVSACAGIAFFPDHGQDADSLVRAANAALHRAKGSGRGRHLVYELSMASGALDKLSLEHGLHEAMQRDQFFMEYQPKVAAASGQTLGVEALLRWRSPEHGLVSPDRFIPVAEERGLIGPIGAWVLRTACEDLARLRETLGRPFSMAVNLSPRQMEDRSLPSYVAGLLREHSIPPDALQLEVTESLFVGTSGPVMRVFDELKALGVEIAVDDFGTGYSALNYLRRFPVDRLKVDKIFVQDLVTDRLSQGIVRAIVAMADGLGLGVTAEGVETLEQYEAIRDAGCREVQGFYFGRPMSLPELISFLERAA